MDAKLLLRNSWKLLSLFRVAGVQTLALFFASYAVGLASLAYGVRGCPGRKDFNNWFTWLICAIAVFVFGLALFYIIRPSVWMQRINKRLAMNPTDINLPFFSTHPSYVFIDAIFLIPAIALFQAGRSESLCQLNDEWAFGVTLLSLALFFPLFRIISWYGFKRKIRAMAIKPPLDLIAMWWIVALPVLIYITYSILSANVFPKLRLPVVNQKTFAGGLDKNPGFQNGIVRVQGIMVRGIAECGLFGKNPEQFQFPAGTVLLDMGDGNGQIMVQAKNPSAVNDLRVEAENRQGRVLEAFGRLSKLPNLNKKLVCGIGKADPSQEGGLALLEIEMP